MKSFIPLATLALAGCLLAYAAEPAKSGKQPVRGAPIQKLPPAAPTNATPAEAKAAGTNAPAALGAVQKDGEFFIVGFDRLAAFNYDIPDDAPATTNAPAKNEIGRAHV